MAVTIKDVAKETKLAISTISKYMNGGTVRKENRVLIEAAIQKLGYYPNNMARGLRTSRTYTIGLMTGTVNSPHTAAFVSEVEKKLREMGYSLVFASHEENSVQAKEYIEYMLERGVDGMILTLLGDDIDYLKEIREQKIPVVTVEERGVVKDCDCILVDCVNGSYLIVEHLIESGHRKIAIICGPEHRLTAQERKRGYLRAMEDYEYPVCEKYIIPGDFSYKSGYEGILQLWKLEDKPSAVFVSNYDMCQGAMAAIHALGIRVPEELSIVAFDDFELSVMVRPKLTTVKQPLMEMADVACELLCRRMDGDYSDYPRRIRLKPEAIYRNSVQMRQPSTKELLE
jgi:LacI family transcriptional regulator